MITRGRGNRIGRLVGGVSLGGACSAAGWRRDFLASCCETLSGFFVCVRSRTQVALREPGLCCGMPSALRGVANLAIGKLIFVGARGTRRLGQRAATTEIRPARGPPHIGISGRGG